MSDIETQLRDALSARADLVRTEDLSPRPLPSPGAAPVWWRRPTGYLLVAAVIAVVAVPLVVIGLVGREDPPDRRDPTVTDGRSAPDRLEADVDGDGVEETVRLLRGPEDGRGRAATRLEVEFSQFSGETATYRVGRVGEVILEEPADVDGRGGVEVFVSVDSGLTEEPSTTLTVLAFRDGTLASILDRPVYDGLEEGRTARWWVEDGRLVSTTSTGPVADGAATYPVDAVRWEPAEDTLAEVPLGRRCVSAADPTELRPCGGS